MAQKEEKVFFENSKGDKLCGIINNPTGNKKKPIVILVHGFSSNKNSSTYVGLSKSLGKKDISTFRIDMYGHGESGGKFEDITITEAVDDILQAVKFLKGSGYEKIGLMGSSFGGIASIIAVSKSPELFALALKSPVSNYMDKELETKSKKYFRDWRTKGYTYYLSGDGRRLKLNSTFFKDFEGNNGYDFAPRIKTPTIIVHGDADETVPYKQSVKTSNLIPDCKLHTVKGANHHYDNPKDFQEVEREITNFIVKKAS